MFERFFVFCHVERTLSIVEGGVETSQKRSFGFAQDDLMVSLFVEKDNMIKRNHRDFCNGFYYFIKLSN